SAGSCCLPSFCSPPSPAPSSASASSCWPDTAVKCLFRLAPISRWAASPHCSGGRNCHGFISPANMYLVGLTGGIGCGKSEAARIFGELGVPVIDTDTIAHALTASGHPVQQAIIKEFGYRYLNPEQSLNRAAFRTKVFADRHTRRHLESILHNDTHDVDH